MDGFSTGFRSFFKAIPFIFNNKLWWTFFIPLVLYIILFIVGFSFTDYISEISNSYIENWLGNKGDSKFMQSLPNLVSWLAAFFLKIFFIVVFIYFSGYIILILLSPLFAWISERTDQIINGTDYPFEWGQFTRDIWRGIAIAFRNLFYELGITILVLIATIVPIINFISGPISAIFLFIIASYFYGFSFMDYTNERKRLKVKDSIKLIRKYRGMAIGNGAIFAFSLFVPILGGFTAIIATVGATIAMNELPEIQNINIVKNKT